MIERTGWWIMAVVLGVVFFTAIAVTAVVWAIAGDDEDGAETS